MNTVIVIGGEKGGTGKSTFSTNLAVMTKLMGHDSILLDTDKQASSAKFIEYRNDRNIKPTPPCLQIRGKHLHAEIEDLASRYDIVIIDAGGSDSVELRSAMVSPSVKKMYCPLQPSEFDLETLSTIDELVYLSQSYNAGLKAHIVFNQCPTHSRITVVESSKDYSKTFENINICETTIGHRVPVQYATSKAQAVVEFEIEKILSLPNYQAKGYSPKASIEFTKLYHEIFGEPFHNETLNKYKNESN